VREDYRPIAPVCRIEEADRLYTGGGFDDPYMLYFRRARDTSLRAVTHVDGSARVQTVSNRSNPALHELLTAFGVRHGAGVLCNTSLNFRGHGFINRMTHLIEYCQIRGVSDMVVDGVWFTCARDVVPGAPLERHQPVPQDQLGAVTG
jgi:hydroxymethyl cephem carbamoyltransferase